MYEFQSRLVNKIEAQAGLAPDDYEAYLKPMFVAYAELVHLLPASRITTTTHQAGCCAAWSARLYAGLDGSDQVRPRIDAR